MNPSPVSSKAQNSLPRSQASVTKKFPVRRPSVLQLQLILGGTCEPSIRARCLLRLNSIQRYNRSLRHREAQRRYKLTPKGKQTEHLFDTSVKGKDRLWRCHHAK